MRSSVKDPQIPVAKLVPHVTTTHGITNIDNYFWLRDRKDPATIAYLDAENAYTAAVLKPTEALQATLYKEMLGRIRETDTSAASKWGEYYYYTRTEAGKEYAIYCRRKGSLDAAEEILLDGNAMAEGKKYFRLGNFAPSPDHNLLAYSVDYEGDESYTIRVKNLATGQLLADEIAKTYYTLEWANDNRTFFYTVLDETLRPYQVYRHTLGQAASKLIYQEHDERFNLKLLGTRSRAFVLIEIDSAVTSEVRCLDANRASGDFSVILPRVQGVEYSVSHHTDSDRFFIRTNQNATGFKLLATPTAEPSWEKCKEVIPHREGITIENVSAFEKFLVTEERRNGLMEIHIRDFETGQEHAIAMPEPVYMAEMGANHEYNTTELRFEYTSLVTPVSSFDYNIATRQRTLVKQQPVEGGYDSTQYECERLFATAADGVKIPISLVYRKGISRDGMLLYGYGSYGISIDPEFRSDRLSLLDRGIVFAIAHIRGGMDMGKAWHEAGRMLFKKNTFTDFIACAEHLIAKGYTTPDRLAINGRSAGGLLMGAVTNMRPDLFAAVIAGVPFVDSLNTALDPTLPLTIGEYEEFGNPQEREFYEYMKTYAPYENVGPAKYPAILATAGLNDPRVSYWEPAKWIAKLRSLNQGERPLLLKTEMGSGHFGSSGRYEHLKETAMEYAFLLLALGLKLQ